MSADKDARIAELEQQLMELTARFNEELCGSTFMGEPVIPNTSFETAEWSHLEKQVAVAKDTRIADLDRKLAEQQAILKRIREVYSHGDDLDAPLFESVKLSGDTELNNLLAKAKEEGRKEAVPEHILLQIVEQAHMAGQINQSHRDPSAYEALVYFKFRRPEIYTMLTAAPKPQGETE